MKEGVNGKRQINYYDIDGTRVEVMEPGTYDGKPRPPSTAPAPVGQPKPVKAAAAAATKN
jgi:lactoylglutathione lyase